MLAQTADQNCFMKKYFAILPVLCPVFFLSAPGVDADEMEKLAGKWSVKKTTDEGTFTQVLELKKNGKFTFKIVGSDNKERLYAEGEVKAEKAGAFEVLKFSTNKAGKSQQEAEAAEDERFVVYRLTDDGLFLASNFDKERSQKPTSDLYTK
jgi:hypothetical protein